LLKLTPKQVLDAPTIGTQPQGYTCLHFASEGSDKTFCHAALVVDLVLQGASIEAKTKNGSTPFLLAAATGVTDVVSTLIGFKADIHATTGSMKKGAHQLASQSSSCSRNALMNVGVRPPAKFAESGRYRTNVSESRHTRRLVANATDWQQNHPDTQGELAKRRREQDRDDQEDWYHYRR
jgi:ankyrin repeat protein